VTIVAAGAARARSPFESILTMMTSSPLAAAVAAVGFLLMGGACLADEACKGAFRTSVQPILNTRCVACHQDAARAGGLSLQRTSAPASLLGVSSREARMALVTPGDPLRSYLFRKTAGTHLEVGGNGARMPLGGRLTEAEIKAIEAWITGCTAD